MTAQAAETPAIVECPDCGEGIPVTFSEQVATFPLEDLLERARDRACLAHPEHQPIEVGEYYAEIAGRQFNEIEGRIAAIEELIAHPPMMLEARWTEQQVEDFRSEFAEALKTTAPNGRPRAWDWRPDRPVDVLTPETARALLRECVTVVKPGELLAVRLPLDMNPGDMDRARVYALEVEEQSGIKVAFLPGEEFAAITQGDAG